MWLVSRFIYFPTIFTKHGRPGNDPATRSVWPRLVVLLLSPMQSDVQSDAVISHTPDV